MNDVGKSASQGTELQIRRPQKINLYQKTYQSSGSAATDTECRHPTSNSNASIESQIFNTASWAINYEDNISLHSLKKQTTGDTNFFLQLCNSTCNRILIFAFQDLFFHISLYCWTLNSSASKRGRDVVIVNSYTHIQKENWPKSRTPVA